MPSSISVGVFEDTRQFGSDAFAADEADTGCGLDNRLERLGFDFALVTGSESHSANHPEAIFADSIRWVSDRSQNL
jgi:hypothetical protein